MFPSGSINISTVIAVTLSLGGHASMIPPDEKNNKSNSSDENHPLEIGIPKIMNTPYLVVRTFQETLATWCTPSSKRASRVERVSWEFLQQL